MVAAALNQLSPTARAHDRRRHQRVRVSLLGRYMLSDRREFPCQTIDMSPGGVAVYAPVSGKIGERVVAYFDQIGRVEGMIVRHIENGFVLAMAVPVLKREKIADQLTWLVNRHELGMPEDRRHERIAPIHKRSTLKMADGREHMVRLVDISLSGAAMEVDASAPLGSPVTLGATPARIVRIFEGGLAVEFIRQFPAETFSDRLQF